VVRGSVVRWSGVWALIVGFVFPTAAKAEAKARLVYVRGEGLTACPSEVDLRLWVMARLGYDPFSPQASRVVIARIEAREQQLVSSVEVADQDGFSTGRRELSSKNERCEDLARAMALSISLAIDPERASLTHDAPVVVPAAEPARDTPPAPAPRAPAPVAPARAAPPAAPQKRPEPTRPRAFVRGTFESRLGQLPGVGLGAGLAAGWRWGWASLALEAHGALSLGRELSPAGNLTGALLIGGLAGCAHWGPMGLCAVAHAGQQRLGTHDVAQPSASSGPYVGFGPRLALELPLGRELAVVAGLEGVLDATRNRALLTGREVWKAPLLGATLSVGVGAHFL